MATYTQQNKISRSLPFVSVTAKAMLTAYREQLQSNSQPRLARSYHASSFVECGFKLSQPLLGVYPTNPTFIPDWAFSAALGNAIHDATQKRITDLGYFVGDGPLSPGYEVALTQQTLTAANYEQLQRAGIGGRVDGILQRPSVGQTEKEKVVLEIKTVAEKYLQTAGRWPNWYTEKLLHFESQVQLYMHLLDIVEGIILVISQCDITLDFLGINTVQGPDGKYTAEALWDGNPEYENQTYTFRIADEYRVIYDPFSIYPELARLENFKALVATGKSPAPEPHRGNCTMGKEKCNYWNICPLPEHRRVTK